MDELFYPNHAFPTCCPHCNESLIKSTISGKFTPTQLTVYKYVPFNVAELILTDGAIRLMHPKEANDPFEFFPSFNHRKKNYADIANMIAKSNVLTSSFSRSCHIPAMWGHYAKKGTGVCLGFTLEVTPDMITPAKEITEKNTIKKLPLFRPTNPDIHLIIAPIIYTKKRLTLPENENAFVNDYLPACIKDRSWEYEREIRLLVKKENASFCKQGHYYDNSMMDFLSCIILGPNCQVDVNYMKNFLETNTPKNFVLNDKKSQLTEHIYQATFHESMYTVCSEGHSDTLETEEGEYQKDVPLALYTASTFSMEGIQVYLGGEKIVDNRIHS